MRELKMTGNCLKGSRPLLSFDENFNSAPHWKLIKEMFIQTMGVPNQHPKSQPFFDKVFTFSIVDEKVGYLFATWISFLKGVHCTDSSC